MKSVRQRLSILVPALLAAPAGADPDYVTDFQVDTPWTIRIEPVLWYPGLRGEISFAGGGDSGDQAFKVEVIDLDENELTPAARAELRLDPWSFRLAGAMFDASGDARATEAVNAGPIAIARNAAVSYDLAYDHVELTAGRRLLEVPFGPDDDDVTLLIGAYAGARLYSVDLEVTSGGASVDGDDTWIHPIAGFRLEMLIRRRLSIGLNSDFGYWGGDDESASWNIETGFRWAATEHIELRAGFRHLSVDLTRGSGRDEFIFDNSLAGLAVSVGIRF